MRLGLSAETYRWIAFPWMRTDNSKFRATGHYAPYTLSTAPPKLDAFVPDWLLARSVAHGLKVLTCDVGLLGDIVQARAFGQRCTAVGVELLGSVSLDLAAGPDAWDTASSTQDAARFDAEQASSLRTGWIGASEMAIASVAMTLAKAAGISTLSLVHGQPGRAHRYDSSEPVARQLDHIASNASSLVPEAAALELTLALEPHMDFRCVEFVRVIEAVGSSNLRLVFDVANPLSVNEDPLDAVVRVAPYTVATHLRDMRVQALTEIATGAFFHTPIGEGSVPLAEILQVLNDECPNAGQLPCCLKVVTRPEHDVEAWLMASVASVRENHAPYWSD